MMTQWLARWRVRQPSPLRTPVRKPRSVRLAVEELESRYCPTPVVSGFSATAEAGVSTKQVELKGSVSDSSSGSITVTFSGCGVSASTTLSGSGSFDVITAATSLGSVTASPKNLTTQITGRPVSVPISNQPPYLSNFTATESGSNIWTFSGQVTDDQSVAGLVVTLGGIHALQGVTVTTNSQGWFTYTCAVDPNDHGEAVAQTSDIWGVLSNTAWTLV